MIVAAILAPLLSFIVLSRLTYVLFVNRSAFYPGPYYWLSIMSFLTVIGAILWRVALGSDMRWTLVVYCIVMPFALIELQGIMSCLSGDCI
jgi:hypothetical protein